MDDKMLELYEVIVSYLETENQRLREALANLVDRVDRNGGLGEYKGGKGFALSDAKKALAETEGEK